MATSNDFRRKLAQYKRETELRLNRIKNDTERELQRGKSNAERELQRLIKLKRSR